MRRLITGLLVILLGVPVVAQADDDLLLRSATDPAEAWVGQRVKLRIDVLAKDGWAQVSRFDDLVLPGAYVVRNESQGTRLQEKVDDASYTGQRYEFSIYPQRAGAVEVPAIPVEVMVKTWGADATQTMREAQVPAVTIDVSIPPGAENVANLVSTPRLVTEQQWSSQSEQTKVGDAITRSVTLQADDVSGMAFTPIEEDDLPGVGRYRAEPVVEDVINRGSLSGRRTEKVTYVFERAGSVQIPDITVTWWNTSTQTLESEVLEGQTFRVAPGAVGEGERASGVTGNARRWAGAGIGLLVVGGLFAGRWLARWLRARAEKRRLSEQAIFRSALDSVRSGDAHRAMRDIMRWLDRINDTATPAQLLAFVDQHGADDERVSIANLIGCYGQGQPLEDPDGLIGALETMRARWQQPPRSLHEGNLLPALN
jgi:hypothetical protein